MKTFNLSSLSKILVGLGSLSLFLSIFLPIWRIELDAPQYPEGLVLQIFPNKLGGNVDIINGLNHYIGMGTLHAENFIEFTVLPYIIGGFTLLMLFVLFKNSKTLLYIVFTLFVLFGILAMVDFWRWEYNYGHNLDPNAAIIVPGQAYQPPLIGFKQLLNFGAYSIPDIGGWLFIASGLFLLFAVIYESGKLKFFSRPKSITAMFFAMTLITCMNIKPDPIILNVDSCDHCKMKISDLRFSSELITSKGRIYKFDDLKCLLEYENQNSNIKFTHQLISNFNAPKNLLDANQSFYIVHEELRSPMGGNIAAFQNENSAKVEAAKYQTKVKTWTEIQNL